MDIKKLTDEHDECTSASSHIKHGHPPVLTRCPFDTEIPPKTTKTTRTMTTPKTINKIFHCFGANTSPPRLSLFHVHFRLRLACRNELRIVPLPGTIEREINVRSLSLDCYKVNKSITENRLIICLYIWIRNGR